MYRYLSTAWNSKGESPSMMYTIILGAGTAILTFGCIFRALLRPIKVVSVRRKHCLVTGGSSGIGKELAKQLMREGAHVTIAARRQDVLDDALEEILACQVSPDQMAQAVSMDVGNPKEVEQVVAKAVSVQGPVQKSGGGSQACTIGSGKRMAAQTQAFFEWCDEHPVFVFSMEAKRGDQREVLQPKCILHVDCGMVIANITPIRRSLDHLVSWILANCAGFAVAKEFDEMEASDLERLMRVNTLGTAYVTRALLPGMKAAGGGRILFTSSMCGLTGIYGYVGYSGSKFALVGMAQALQMEVVLDPLRTVQFPVVRRQSATFEVKAYGIGISVAYPPDTDTPGFATENVGKPPATHRISQSSGLFSPSKVALRIVRGLERGDFCITFGAEGYFVGLGTAGFSPCFSVWEAIMQVLSASLLRAIFLLCTCGFYRIAAEEKRTRAVAAARGDSSTSESVKFLENHLE